MQQLSNLDCLFLARELNETLVGNFFENFYDYENGVFRLRFGKQSVLADLKGFLFATQEFPEPPKQPSSFAMLVRKRLSSAKLESVQQLGFDRILEFKFSSKQFVTMYLVIELFGKQGNLLLLDSERKIVKPFKKASYAARSLADGLQYVLPPSSKKHPLELQESDLVGKGRVVSFLSKQTSLAPFYLEEAAARVGIALDKDISEVNASVMLSAVSSLFKEKSPRVFLKDGVAFAFSSIELQKFEGEQVSLTKTVSEALMLYYPSVKVAPVETGGSDLDFQLKSQSESLSGFEVKSGESQKVGKWIFENNDLVNELIEAARSKDQAKLEAIARKQNLKVRLDKQFLELEF